MPINIFNIFDQVFVNGKTDNGLFSKSVNFKFEDNYELNHDLVPINDLIKNIVYSESIEIDTGIMPPGVLAINKNFIVFERKPDYKNIFLISKLLNEINDQDESTTFRIPIPWQLYIVQYGITTDSDGRKSAYPINVKMHFMKSNLMDLDQEVFMAPLPNFYPSGDLCRPMFSSMGDINTHSDDIAGVIYAAYDWVWNSGSNLDLTSSVVNMFAQFDRRHYSFAKDPSNSIWCKDSFMHPPTFISYDSFYCSPSQVRSMLATWEKSSIEEVINYEWPSNIPYKTFNEYRRRYIYENFPNYILSLGLDPYYELHYDDDNGNEYQCEYDESDYEICDCLMPRNNVSVEEFLIKTEFYPIKTLTYSQSLDRFAKEYLTRFSHYSFKNYYGNTVTNFAMR